MRRLRRFTFAKRKVLVIKYAGDTRYTAGEELSSHDRVTMAAAPASCLAAVAHLVKDSEVIGIDEGQFYPDLVECVEQWADAGKIIIIAALDGDFRRKPFGRVLELVPLAEHVTKLSAVCTGCGRDAAFTKRTVAAMQLQLIGGSEAYVPNCRQCFTGLAGADAMGAGVPVKSTAVTPASKASLRPDVLGGSSNDMIAVDSPGEVPMDGSSTGSGSSAGSPCGGFDPVTSPCGPVALAMLE